MSTRTRLITLIAAGVAVVLAAGIALTVTLGRPKEALLDD
jgi:hypothetical protein